MKKYIFIFIPEIKYIKHIIKYNDVEKHYNIINTNLDNLISPDLLIEKADDKNKLSIIFYQKASLTNDELFDKIQKSKYFNDIGMFFSLYGEMFPSFLDLDDSINISKLNDWLLKYQRKYALETLLINK
jgi:hypothetical protein